jgi:hypothetical protein
MMDKHKEIRLIVLDSIAGLFRVDFGPDQTPQRYTHFHVMHHCHAI